MGIDGGAVGAGNSGDERAAMACFLRASATDTVLLAVAGQMGQIPDLPPSWLT